MFTIINVGFQLGEQGGFLGDEGVEGGTLFVEEGNSLALLTDKGENHYVLSLFLI